jgi:hypothetical protein
MRTDVTGSSSREPRRRGDPGASGSDASIGQDEVDQFVHQSLGQVVAADHPAVLPTPDAVRGQANPAVRALPGAAHLGNRRKAGRAGARFGYLFQRPDGGHLQQFATLVDSGRLRPVIDRAVPFAEAPEALAHVERGGGPGKTVLSMEA